MLVELPSGRWIDAAKVVAMTLTDHGTTKPGPPSVWEVLVDFRCAVRATEPLGQLDKADAVNKYREIVAAVRGGRAETLGAVVVPNPALLANRIVSLIYKDTWVNNVRYNGEWASLIETLIREAAK